MVEATIEDLAITTRSSRESDSQAVLQLIKWEIFNKNIPFYCNIGVYSTGYALDSSVFWPFYPILLSDSELQHSLAVRRRGCIEHDFTIGLEMRADTGTEAGVVEIGS